MNLSSLDIFKPYDVLLVDVYGVLWDGSKPIEGAAEALEKLKNQGKYIIILSNTTQLSGAAIEKFVPKGFVKGRHYHEYITSGEVLHQEICLGKLDFKGCSNPEKYYQFGTPNKKLFSDSKYIEVDSLDKADFVYISIPQISEEELGKVPVELRDSIFESTLPKEGIERCWDSTDLDVFMPEIERIVLRGLPVLNANPDLRAAEVSLVESNESATVNFVIRQGAIAEKLQELGLEVVQTGKPYVSVYEYAFKLLEDRFNWSDKGGNISRVCMIGDTLETDIMGASNASSKLGINVDSALTLTGVTANLVSQMVSPSETVASQRFLDRLKKICHSKKIVPIHIIKKLG